MTSINDILNMLPYRMRSRFESLSAYVTSVIEEEESSTAPIRRLSRTEIQQIQWVVLSVRLTEFFREGTRAAKNAIGVFDKLGMAGFTVGKTLFEGENENVVRGEKLADDLLSRLEADSKTLIATQSESESSIGLRTLIKQLMRRAINARTMD